MVKLLIRALARTVYVRILCALLLLLPLVACTSKQADFVPFVPMQRSAPTPPSGVFPQVIEIQLVGNITTGYSWEYTIQPEGIVGIAAAFREPVAGYVGAKTLFTFHFQALKQGEAFVSFFYRRPWERDIDAPQQVVYVITVAEDNTIRSVREL